MKEFCFLQQWALINDDDNDNSKFLTCRRPENKAAPIKEEEEESNYHRLILLGGKLMKIETNDTQNHNKNNQFYQIVSKLFLYAVRQFRIQWTSEEL